jgi:hypothetical protein
VSLNVHGKYNLLNILIMKKSILNLGKALNKAEQKSINGGRGAECGIGYSWDSCVMKCITNRKQTFGGC